MGDKTVGPSAAALRLEPRGMLRTPPERAIRRPIETSGSALRDARQARNTKEMRRPMSNSRPLDTNQTRRNDRDAIWSPIGLSAGGDDHSVDERLVEPIG
jgi:hypothetical protein